MAGTVRKWNFDLRSVLTIIILFLAGCSTLFGQNSGTGTAASVRAGRKPVDMQGIDAYSIKYQDTTALCLVGGVMFYHNGTIITCDSAVRYSERRMECFRNVIINKDSLYVYGDRAEYNGETNMAYIYSPLIKVVDGDATMYTYNFSYNTLDNVGKFSGGAIVTKGDNRLESQRGYYYADSSEVICVEDVSMRDSTYQLQSDSVIYNLETDVARFFDHADIKLFSVEFRNNFRGLLHISAGVLYLPCLHGRADNYFYFAYGGMRRAYFYHRQFRIIYGFHMFVYIQRLDHGEHNHHILDGDRLSDRRVHALVHDAQGSSVFMRIRAGHILLRIVQICLHVGRNSRNDGISVGRDSRRRVGHNGRAYGQFRV